MANEISPDERVLQQYLGDELRIASAHLPRARKTLSQLLREEYPHVLCSDGSVHLFKHKELEYLAGLVSPAEQETLLLPILLELVPGQGEAIVRGGRIEAEIVAKTLDMPLLGAEKEPRLYKPQLSALRRVLRTTTQYVFPLKGLD